MQSSETNILNFFFDYCNSHFNTPRDALASKNDKCARSWNMFEYQHNLVNLRDHRAFKELQEAFFAAWPELELWQAPHCLIMVSTLSTFIL